MKFGLARDGGCYRCQALAEGERPANAGPHHCDCPNASWWETRSYLEGPRLEGKITVSRRALREMFEGIYGKTQD